LILTEEGRAVVERYLTDQEAKAKAKAKAKNN